MTMPRQVLAGSTYLVTRRCTQRQFWLKPTKLTNQIIAYCVAYAATLTGVQVHALCVLSNHWHAVASDPHGRLPEFMHWVHKHIAKCINASYGRWENLWASEPPSAVRLEDDDDVLDKIAYTLANPVAAGLVEHGSQWPGLRTAARDVAGMSVQVARPPVFFRDDGPMPESVTLELFRPAIHQDRNDRELGQLVATVVAQREAQARADVAAAGRTFLGVRAIRAQRPSDRPRTAEPRRGLNPRVAARNKWLRIEALRRLKEFVSAYRRALHTWKSGVRDVVFPAGCYAMRVHQGVLVADSA
jgi:REP element-mobilizing transposase RayT